ncbi:MAG: DNA recombination protein RmuC [Bacteriovoracaceae bacterium]|nr:DNA recombination protein RmuC [Bacteriovoracaceae bacterium]
MSEAIIIFLFLNFLGLIYLILKNKSPDFSFLTLELKPLSDKLIQLEVMIQQRFENQKEVNKLQVSEIIEDKFKRVTAEQNKSTQDLIQRFSDFQHILSKQLVSMNEKITKDMQVKLDEISDRVRENLDQGFKKTNETFTSVIERLAKIDEAQKKIESLSTNVVSLQDLLTDKKSRGIFGEVQLNQILHSVFGEKNDKVYRTQYKLSNGTMCDSILFLPEPTGNIVVDSKFPLENFRRMFDLSFTDVERKEFVKDFKNNLKKHIDDINMKYIIPGETTDQAILFLPAEAIFAELYAYHPDVIEYAHNKRVWITSPTTFMAMLTTIQVVIQNIERSKYTNVIHQELNKLADEFSRYKKRWDSLASHIETVSKDVKDIHVTTEKITNRFGAISSVQIDHLIEP